MSVVNADVDALLHAGQNIQTAISSIESTKSSITNKYQQLGSNWHDKKYDDLGDIVTECIKSLNAMLKALLQGEKTIALLVKSLQEYEAVSLGNDTTSTHSTTTFSHNTIEQYPSNSFGSGIKLVQDRLSSERFFSQGNHFEEYRDFWESDNFSYSRNDNPQIVFVRARDIEGVYVWESERNSPQNFWTRNGTNGWSRDNIMRRASHIQEIQNMLESGIPIEDLSQNDDYSETIDSYFRDPVQVASLDSFYVFQSDGRHRILAAQDLDSYIPVIITTHYTRNAE